MESTAWIKDREHKYSGYDEPLGDTEATWDQKVHKVYIVDDERRGSSARSRENETADGDFSFFQYQQYSMEIVAKGCSKSSGMKTLLEYLNIKPEEVMAIGDHTNDVEVIKVLV